MNFQGLVMMTDEKDQLSLTDDEENDEFDDEPHLPELSGILNKWTNYIHGWQDRYIILKDGTLSYYKSENDLAFGCRGAISLAKASIMQHQFDECRFDVSVNDCLWYLRASNSDERQKWIDHLEIHKANEVLPVSLNNYGISGLEDVMSTLQAESGYGSESSLRRQSSMLSLTSTASLSTASTSSFKRGRGLREKLLEMETFRDILCRQVDTLQSYFDACVQAMSSSGVHDMVHDDIEDDVDDFNNPPIDTPTSDGSSNGSTNGTENNHKDFREDLQAIQTVFQAHGAHAIDFKGEAFTFKATTAGILATLGHCIELMNQREDAWRRRLEREVEKRKKIEDGYKGILADRAKPIVVGGPDYEEGPHCVINDEEFFDAVDATLDKLETDFDKKVSLKRQLIRKASNTERKPPKTSLSPHHPLYGEINDVVNENVQNADFDMDNLEKQGWMLLVEDVDMKVYKKEIEEDGMIVDPLKAVYTCKGVTGREVCKYFWDTDVRMEWEGTLESTNNIEWMSEDTVISHQIHKRIWPATQRDSLFWSHIRHVSGGDDEEEPDMWIVVNHSTDHPDINNSKLVRVKFNITMMCKTVIEPPAEGKEISRDNIICKIQYTANVNPGGWAPASVLRAVAKREYPKFLKRFTSYVKDVTNDKPILF